MTYRVKIIDCLEQFHHAHEALIESLGGADHIARMSSRGQNHLTIMQRNWELKYKAKPVEKNGSWRYLDFDSEKHYIAFILRWS